MVSTGAINDIGQLTICENNMHSAVPSAIRKMRTLAMLMRLSSATVLEIAVDPTSEGIGQETGNSDRNLADKIE